MEPRVAYRHPILDRKFNVTSDTQVFTDDELKRLTEDYIRAAKIAADIGADFVDIKHCHGYLLHEFLMRAHACWEILPADRLKTAHGCCGKLWRESTRAHRSWRLACG